MGAIFENFQKFGSIGSNRFHSGSTHSKGACGVKKPAPNGGVARVRVAAIQALGEGVVEFGGCA